MKILTPNETSSRHQSGSPLLLDVRTPAEIRQHALKDTTCVPHEKVGDCPDLDKLPRDQEIILICQSGKRAKIAGEQLSKKGFSELSIMEGGVNAWLESDLPVTQGKNVMSLERQVRIAAGFLVALGSALALSVSPAWIILPAFVGCGLAFAGLTDTCGMGMLIARMPWNR